MTSILLKDKLQEEINLIPEAKLADLYNFIHYFRLGTEKTQETNKDDILAFAGCWKKLDSQIFQDVMTERSTNLGLYSSN